jgi:hypothetical protein
VLWVCDVETELAAIDMDGRVVDRIDRHPDYRIFGLATFEDDPDGANIYAFCRDDSAGNAINKLNPDSSQWTHVVDLDLPDELQAGGACITQGWDAMLVVMAGMLLGDQDVPDRIGLYQISARTDWITLENEDGVLEADSDGEIPIEFDATGFPINTDLEAEIVITHNGRGGEIVIPVILHVVHPDQTSGESELLPGELSITCTYPNPFNGSMRVDFRVPRSGSASLELLDFSGRVIETIMQDDMKAGVNSLTVKTVDYPSGIYMLRLRSGGAEALQKVTLLK